MDFLINSNVFLLIATIVANLGLGSFIFLKDRKNKVNNSFSVILFLISLWSFSNLVFIFARSPEWVLFWRRITPCGGALLAGYFLYFSLLFPSGKTRISALQKLLILGPGYVFAGLSVFSRLLIGSFVFTDIKYPFLGIADFGPLYKIYSIYLIVYFGWALFNLFVKFTRSEKLERLKIFYVLTGMTLAVIAGIVVSLLLPIFGVSQFFTLGPPFTLIMTGFITYAIIRYRLLGIEDFLSRGVNVLLGTAAIITFFSFLFIGRIDLLLPFSLILIQSVLGFYVLIKNPKNEINLSFAAFCFALAFWSFSAFMLQHATNIYEVIVWGRYIFVGPILIAYFFLCFTFVFPKRITARFELKRMLLFAPTLLFLIFTPGTLILKTAVLGASGPIPKWGMLYPFFALYFLAYFLYGIFNLVQKYLRSRGIERTQIRYVFLGLFLSFLFGIITNLALPALGEARLLGLGPYFTLFLIGFTMYAILKHRLMSIEVVIQRSAVYGIVTILIMALYALAVIISETFLRQIMGYSSLLVTAAAALLIAVLYQPMIRTFQGITDRLFFRGRYDYRKTLQEISQRIASVIKLEELTQLIVSSFIDTMKISEISFLLVDKEKEHFRSVPISLPRYKKIEIDVESPIVSWLNSAKDVLVRDEIEDEIGRQEALGEVGNIRKHSMEEVRDEMERIGISVWVPIISKEEMIGIIALGNKLSGDIFSTEDIGLLSTLGSQTAVALDNARLYDEVVNMKDYSEEILQSMITGVMTVDTRGKIVTFNSMAERITGRRRVEVLGKSCEDIWGRRGTIPNVITNSLKDRCYINFESSIASPERGLVPVAFTSTVLRDHQQKKIGALLTIRDLSEVKELEEKVRRADKLTALATMAAGMAHEIKNPLSSMKVLSQLLPKKYDDMEFRKKMEEIVPREINRIDRIVESLLSFARATALTFEKVNVNDLLEENVKYFQDQAEAVDVKIKTDYADLPEIELDKGQLSQVFSNLMLNAIQAMSEGGELKVVTLLGKKIMDQLQTVIVKISDTGHGMPEETVNKLFDPFFTTKHGGTGLGLTISHNIVDGHGGYIDVESKAGKGTTFTITLPVSQRLV